MKKIFETILIFGMLGMMISCANPSGGSDDFFNDNNTETNLNGNNGDVTPSGGNSSNVYTYTFNTLFTLTHLKFTIIDENVTILNERINNHNNGSNLSFTYNSIDYEFTFSPNGNELIITITNPNNYVIESVTCISGSTSEGSNAEYPHLQINIHN